jgi:cytochrome c oxidase subunit II
VHIDRYERYWLIAVAAMLGAFAATLFATVVVFGIRLPGPAGRVNPQNLADSEFANPGVTNLGNNTYEVYVVARMWAYDMGAEAGTPPTLRFPKGSEVTFYVTSKDITHGFYIQDHTLNLEVVPGQIAKASMKFNEPGTYKIICNEYCGAGHAVMYGTIIIE